MKSMSPSSNCSNQVQQRRHVTFANDANNTVHDMESHRDYSASERQDIWYSASELRKISSQASSDARRRISSDGGLILSLYKIVHKKMDSNDDIIQSKLNKYCQTPVGEYQRGIEHLADERLNHAQIQDRQKVRFTVLYLQRQLQQSCGHVDPLKLAKTCMAFSQFSVQFATMMGKADEQSVLATIEKEPMESSSLSWSQQEDEQQQQQQQYYEELEEPLVATTVFSTPPKRFTRSNRIPLPATARMKDTFPKAA